MPSAITLCQTASKVSGITFRPHVFQNAVSITVARSREQIDELQSRLDSAAQNQSMCMSHIDSSERLSDRFTKRALSLDDDLRDVSPTKTYLVQRFKELLGIDIASQAYIFADAHRVQWHWLRGPVYKCSHTGSHAHALNTPQHSQSGHVRNAHFKQLNV